MPALLEKDAGDGSTGHGGNENQADDKTNGISKKCAVFSLEITGVVRISHLVPLIPTVKLQNPDHVFENVGHALRKVVRERMIIIRNALPDK